MIYHRKKIKQSSSKFKFTMREASKHTRRKANLSLINLSHYVSFIFNKGSGENKTARRRRNLSCQNQFSFYKSTTSSAALSGKVCLSDVIHQQGVTVTEPSSFRASLVAYNTSY